MPASYLARHRPICAVLMEIRKLAEERVDVRTVNLCDEALDYARRMSLKLSEYKQASTESLEPSPSPSPRQDEL